MKVTRDFQPLTIRIDSQRELDMLDELFVFFFQKKESEGWFLFGDRNISPEKRDRLANFKYLYYQLFPEKKSRWT